MEGYFSKVGFAMQINKQDVVVQSEMDSHLTRRVCYADDVYARLLYSSVEWTGASVPRVCYADQ
jgi:hypothetical protein